jgi:hypothetical protein
MARKAGTGVTITSHGGITASQFPPTAKRIISIHMLGAVSQVDSFDYKPLLEKMQGQEIPPCLRPKVIRRAKVTIRRNGARRSCLRNTRACRSELVKIPYSTSATLLELKRKTGAHC